MKKIIYLIFSKEVVAGDDGKSTLREIGAAWFLVLSLILTVVAFFVPLALEALLACYGMTVTLIGISSTKSGFDNFIKSKYGAEGKNAPHNNMPIGG